MVPSPSFESTNCFALPIVCESHRLCSEHFCVFCVVVLGSWSIIPLPYAALTAQAYRLTRFCTQLPPGVLSLSLGGSIVQVAYQQAIKGFRDGDGILVSYQCIHKVRWFERIQRWISTISKQVCERILNIGNWALELRNLRSYTRAVLSNLL